MSFSGHKTIFEIEPCLYEIVKKDISLYEILELNQCVKFGIGIAISISKQSAIVGNVDNLICSNVIANPTFLIRGEDLSNSEGK